MDGYGVIKVSDFGLTENLYTRNYFRQVNDGAKLPIKWMALESIKLGLFTEKSDMVRDLCCDVIFFTQLSLICSYLKIKILY